MVFDCRPVAAAPQSQRELFMGGQGFPFEHPLPGVPFLQRMGRNACFLVKPRGCHQNARSPSYVEAADGRENRMSIARLVVIAAVTAVSGITAGGAHAEECPQWLKWVCSSGASPNAVATQDAGQNK